ncbi:MAG: hypothetical protein PF482_15695 [Desulfobacteraceae bacterium]|jgi:hypothetical protein|nr:hypothetical protein [Desulfobacteraceae bacterium]
MSKHSDGSKVIKLDPSTASAQNHGNGSESDDRGQARITCPPQVVSHSSIDTLHLSLHADLSKSELLDRIEESRQLARDLELDKVPFTFKYFTVGFNVHRSGRRFFNYHISTADTHIFFNRRNAQGNFPTCLIEIGSQSSWNPGVFKIFKNIESYFQSARIKILKHTISRVDFCTDFIDQPFKDYDFGNVDKWICRANHFGVYYSGRKASGISYGKGNLVLRVYDKRKELSDTRSTAKQEFFNSIWQDTLSPVTRVEFQIRRETIKEFRFGSGEQKIETIYDLLYAQNEIWSYCSKHWARHTATEVD